VEEDRKENSKSDGGYHGVVKMTPANTTSMAQQWLGPAVDR
jgi:hypothetical protein